MPRVQREVHPARIARTPKPKARRGRGAAGAPAAGSDGQGQATEGGAEVVAGEVSPAQRSAELGELTLDEVGGPARLAVNEEAAAGDGDTPPPAAGDTPPQEAEATPAEEKPEAAMELAAAGLRMVVDGVVMLTDAPLQPEEVEKLGSLRNGERQLLGMFAGPASRSLDGYAKAAEEYGGLIFLGMLGVIAYSRMRMVERITKQRTVDVQPQFAQPGAAAAADTEAAEDAPQQPARPNITPAPGSAFK